MDLIFNKESDPMTLVRSGHHRVMLITCSFYAPFMIFLSAYFVPPLGHVFRA
jgi:hypothetical protein